RGHLASEEAVNIVTRVYQQQVSHGGKVGLDDVRLGEGAFRQQTLVDQAVLLHGEAMSGTNVNRVAGVVDNEHGLYLSLRTPHPNPLPEGRAPVKLGALCRRSRRGREWSQYSP